MKSILALLAITFTWAAYSANTGIEEAVAIPASMSELLTTIEIEGRTLLTDENSITLYTFDRDSENQTACSRGCLKVWPAVIVTNEDLVEAPFGTIVRPDSGELQLTINNLPLYYFFQDKKPGDLFGEYTDWRPIPVSK